MRKKPVMNIEAIANGLLYTVIIAMFFTIITGIWIFKIVILQAFLTEALLGLGVFLLYREIK